MVQLTFYFVVPLLSRMLSVNLYLCDLELILHHVPSQKSVQMITFGSCQFLKTWVYPDF